MIDDQAGFFVGFEVFADGSSLFFLCKGTGLNSIKNTLPGKLNALNQEFIGAQ